MARGIYPCSYPCLDKRMYTDVGERANTVAYATFYINSVFQDTGGPRRTPAYVGTGDDRIGDLLPWNIGEPEQHRAAA